MRTLGLATILSLLGCASGPADESPMIRDHNPAEHEGIRFDSRWSIEVYSGPGLSGSPDANNFILDYRSVLQRLVDDCRLGATVLEQATDGVSILWIVNPSLSADQVTCVRAAAREGLRLDDSGTERADEMESID